MTTPAISPRILTLTFALRKAIADLVKAEVDAERADIFEHIAALHEETGASKLAVKLPNGDKVADLILTQPAKKEVVQDDVLLAWAKESHPDLVEIIEHEPVPARVEERVDMDALRTLGLSTLEDGTVVTESGEPVDGLSYVTPPPTSFSVKYATGGRDALVAAYRAGDLAEVPTGATLPQIER